MNKLQAVGKKVVEAARSVCLLGKVTFKFDS